MNWYHDNAQHLHYVEVDGVAKPWDDDDPIGWAKWMETADRVVEQTMFSDDTVVSTVFLGLNHQFVFGPPKLYETMVFRDDKGMDEEQWRYSTREEAAIGHAAAVERVREVYERKWPTKIFLYLRYRLRRITCWRRSGSSSPSSGTKKSANGTSQSS